MTTFNRFLILSLVLALQACSTVDNGKFSVMSLAPIDKSKSYEKVEENVMGVDTAIYWAFYAGNPRLDAALADALKKYSGDYMTNVRIKWSFWMIPIIYGEKKYEVTGDVWRAKPGPTANSISSQPISN